MSMLQYFLDNSLVHYASQQPQDWQQAIRISCEALKRQGFVTDQYVDAVIDCVNEHGPYIVIAPGIAMPHAMSSNPGVLGTAISFTKFKKPVTFFDEKTGERPEAELFFTLAAQDSDTHLSNIQRLMELLMDEELIEKIKLTHTIEDFQALVASTR